MKLWCLLSLILSSEALHGNFKQIASFTPKVSEAKNPYKYMIDIDGTICSKTESNYVKAKPIRTRINFFNKLYLAGHEVHYWTARGSNSGKCWDALTVNQLDSWGVLYSSINIGKPHYDIWIDDKAINADDLHLVKYF